MICRSSLGLMALIGLAELLNGCYAYVPSSPKHLRGRQNGVAGCSETFTAAKGDDCQFISSIYGISVENLIKWNPSLKSPADCDKLLQPGTTYCVSVPSTTTKTTTNGTPNTTITKTTTNSTTKPTTTPAPTTPSNGVTTPSPIQSGMVTNCNKFHLVASGQTCQDIMAKFSLTLDLLVKWNPAIGKQCSSMWAANYLCVGVIGGTPTKTTTAAKTTTTAANGTPSPLGANTTKDCKKWALAKSGDTCQTILDRSRDVKSTIKDLFRWNPSVKADCSGLRAGYYICIVGPAAPTTTTKPTPANPTPSPIQSGQVKNCKTWYFVKDGETCQDVLKKYPKVTLAQLVTWNPAIGKNCATMWAKTYLCVGV
ncbi:hypothetical protein TWF106_005020 [Orbilia oligospora]|uniref:LysM domain-containing protein n=1 Tax=Orbilia oligospora TaxID=2813651 RepID=A0A7C8Q626_ORBOL|nr:hypothetical protein TWF106_005020 [Orbilia oligospora]